MYKIKARIIFSILLIFAIFITGCSSEGSSSNSSTKGSAEFPGESINWIIPFSPGSGADTFARALIGAVSKELGVEIVPTNVEGGSTAVGVAQVLSKPADGYTLGSNSSTLVSVLASGDAPFSEDQVFWLARINADFKVLAVNSKSGIATMEEFVKYATENRVKIGGVGVKSWSDIFAKKFINQKSLSAEYIPYDGGSEAVTALLGEHIDAIVATSSNVNELAASGDFNVLAVSTAERVDNYPNVPTFDELGFENMSDDLLWRGIFAKPGIPEEHLNVLVNAFEKALEDPTWKEYMEKQNQLDAFMGYEEFNESVGKELSEYKELLGN